MKKGAWLVLVICLCCLLSGCCLKHDWQAATCTAPETCAKCGETQGEALGHQWMAADYQTPETCSVCGETQGEALTPDFEAYGLDSFMELGKTYDYRTACYDDPSYSTVGQATVTEYAALSPSADSEAIDGYEWRKVTIEIAFSDDNANDYGISVAGSTEDYYDVDGYDESSEWHDDNTATFAVNWNGQRYDQCLIRKDSYYSDWQGRQSVYTAYYEYRIPVGYDGSIISLYNQQTSWEDEEHIYDVADADTLFFRLTPIE